MSSSALPVLARSLASGNLNYAFLPPFPPLLHGASKMMPPRLQVVFWLDVTLLLSVCALESVPFTGMIVHEWLGLAFPAMIVAHLLLSWPWIASSTRRLRGGASARTRVNYFLNLSLFACMTVVIVSGILISQQAVPALSRTQRPEMEADFRWADLHNRLSDLAFILAALHLAVNWEWSVAAARKLLRRRASG